MDFKELYKKTFEQVRLSPDKIQAIINAVIAVKDKPTH